MKICTLYETYPFFQCLILGQKSKSETRDGTVFFELSFMHVLI